MSIVTTKGKIYSITQTKWEQFYNPFYELWTNITSNKIVMN